MGALASLAAFAARPVAAQTPPAAPRAAPPAVTRFTPQTLQRLAQNLAKAPARPRVPPVAAAQALSYDDQRRLRFRGERALWADLGGAFKAELFPAVYLSADVVQLFEVYDGRAHPVVFAAEMFEAPDSLAGALGQVAGWSGYRLLHPVNSPDKFDEIGAFQGASYFRSLGRDQQYGLSARGLALKTGEAEEFPRFTSWWIERPAPGADHVVMHALLESDSVTGAYRFQVTPGEAQIFDIEATLYPRVAIDAAGVAPMSSMYLFGPVDGTNNDDFRTGVHDSDGLLIRTSDGGAIWRALANPRQLQMSRFETDKLAGFGLVQRDRDFEHYGDLEARYDKRPTLWVTPLDDWGAGAVQLLEIPTQIETDDNMAAFWRPKTPWAAGKPVTLRYRLSWCDEPPAGQLCPVVRTRIGKNASEGVWLYVVEFGGVGDLNGVDKVTTADVGAITQSTLQAGPESGSARVVVVFKPPATGVAELSIGLTRGGAPISETWRYRWSG